METEGTFLLRLALSEWPWWSRSTVKRSNRTVACWQKQFRAERDLVWDELHSSVDVHQLEGHGKVLVAVCCEGALGFGGIIHPGLWEVTCVLLSTDSKKKKKRAFVLRFLTWWSWCRCSDLCPPQRGPCWWWRPQWTPSPWAAATKIIVNIGAVQL